MLSKSVLLLAVFAEVWLAPLECRLPPDILNSIFSNLTKDKDNYGVEGAVGIIGSEEEIIKVLSKLENNSTYTMEDIKPCLPKTPKEKQPSTGVGMTNLPGYFSPGVSHIDIVETTYPFDYPGGYSTYQNPFLVSGTVADYKPNSYRQTTNLTELFLELLAALRRSLTQLFVARANFH